jgi:hypothetical protein
LNDSIGGEDQSVADAEGQHHADDDLVSIELALRLESRCSNRARGIGSGNTQV